MNVQCWMTISVSEKNKIYLVGQHHPIYLLKAKGMPEILWTAHTFTILHTFIYEPKMGWPLSH